MEILEEMPVILTKDKDWIVDSISFKIGAGFIMLLPSDAILVIAPKSPSR